MCSSFMVYPNSSSFIVDVYDKYPVLRAIVADVSRAGGVVLAVGGSVRDWLLNRMVADYDIEVHGISYEHLETILSLYGRVYYEGKSFGVLRIEGVPIDWSLPRIDKAGRHPLVTIDPFLSYEQAFKRRDLTINAIGIDLINGTIIDPFNGYGDIIHKRLKAPSAELFIEDPLRFYRVMRFIGVLDMVPDDTLNSLCSSMDITGVAHERVVYEYTVLLLKAKSPSAGLRWLRHIDRLAVLLPELHALIGVSQRPDFHPEGDVFEHTMQTIDAMALISQGYSQEQRLVLLYSALAHDIGKALTTVLVDGVWRSTGHADVGAKIVPSLLMRMVISDVLVKKVSLLVRYHMSALPLVRKNSPLSAYKLLARDLGQSVSLRMLADLARADKAGRNPCSQEPLLIPDYEVDRFLWCASQAGVLEQPEPPLLRGRDIIDIVPSGVEMGALLKYAYEIQLKDAVYDKIELKNRILCMVNRHES